MSKNKCKIFSVKFSCVQSTLVAMSDFGKAVLLLLLVVGLVGAAPNYQTRSSTETSVQKTVSDKGGKNLTTDGGKLPPVEREGESIDFNGLIEVNEDEIPEGALVYVLDEPLDQSADEDEILNTANNIVFRPLFRYRGKQEFRRRSSQRFRRRYFVPRRNAYNPYYQPYRYHY